MAQITIAIPDDLVQQLAPFQSQFSNLFTRLIAATLLGQPIPGQSLAASPAFTTSATYQEILDFLVSQPTLEQIMGFKISETSQSRLRTLLQKNREATLTSAETAELDLYKQFDTLIGFLKARALTGLKSAPNN
ncbi:hypothetical protein H6F75_11530 [Nodosilinea sp. FACHB-131]|uniref:hypothetical protein n=1 Tax=Cyanophyceae TaxID=3028117 RepID=UPI001682921E|nr:hypothetical protein [Nodosilinea sp. FACHB-131]MBD1874119.1 hypothetical protein [Nodosilinea sp. FACHB-131]